MAILLLLFSLIGVSAAAQESAAGFYEDALLRFQSDDYRGAIVQLKNALQADSENLPSRILLGRTYLRLGAAAAAEVELRAARARGADPDLIAVPLGRAYLLERRFEHLFDEISQAGRSQEEAPGQRRVNFFDSIPGPDGQECASGATGRSGSTPKRVYLSGS